MTRTPTPSRGHWAGAVASTVMLAAIYVPALARGRLSGSYESFTHPWGNGLADLAVLFLVLAALWNVTRLLRPARSRQRLAALGLLSLPVWIACHFAYWWWETGRSL